MTDVVTDDALVADDEISDGLVRTQVQLVFSTSATVGAVNDLLRRIDGRMVSSRAGVAIAVVEIPDPGSEAALDQLLGSLAAEPALRTAMPVFVPPPDEVPDHIATVARDGPGAAGPARPLAVPPAAALPRVPGAGARRGEHALTVTPRRSSCATRTATSCPSRACTSS